MEDNNQNQNDDSPRSNILFGKYEKGKLLGHGTFAKEYQATNFFTGESVAIKVINKDQVKTESLMQQIKREISVMRLVRHPNVVELKEVLATKTNIYFVMEHVKGGELFDKVAKGRLKEDLARKYFQQLVSAVDFCHSRGVSHRDLKPENLLLSENGDLKVSDFGLSSLPEQLRNDGMLYTTCGTPAYVAPEVLRRKGYDGAKADIWSCGVILFVLLAGDLPFQDENRLRLFLKIFGAEYEFPRWFSSGAKGLISKLLVVNPQKRITIPEIMKVSWFQKGFVRPSGFSIQEVGNHSHSHHDVQDELKDGALWEQTSPPFFNAFEFISSMSSGLDLSGMFEHKRKSGSMFTSRSSPSDIIKKLVNVAKKLNFMVSVRGFKVKLQGKEEGRKGRLSVTVEVFKVAPEMTVVEFSKSSGDTLEYTKFCEEDIRPALNDIVWSWQEDLNFVSGKRKFMSSKAYSSSKVAEIMFSSILQRYLPPEVEVSVICVSPGSVVTNVVRDLPKTVKIAYRILPFFLFSAQEGSRSALYAATDPQIPSYCRALKANNWPVCAYISHACRPISASIVTHNLSTAQEVWDQTLDMVGLPSTALEKLLKGEEVSCRYDAQ